MDSAGPVPAGDTAASHNAPEAPASQAPSEPHKCMVYKVRWMHVRL